MFGKVVSLDLGHYSLKAIFAEVRFQTIQIEKIVMLERTANETDYELLMRLTLRHPFNGYKLVNMITSELVQIRIIDLPFENERNIKAVLKTELDSLLPLGSDHSISDFSFIEKTTKNSNNLKENKSQSSSSRLITFSISKSYLNEFLHHAQELGLTPGFIGSEALAFSSLMPKRLEEHSQKETLLLDLGYHKTTLFIMRNQRIIGIRTITIGSKDFNSILSEVLEIDEQSADPLRISLGQYLLTNFDNKKTLNDFGISRNQLTTIQKRSQELLGELLRELRLSLMSFISETNMKTRKWHTAENLFLFGGFSRQKGLAQILSQSLGVPIIRIAPLIEGEEMRKLQSIVNEDNQSDHFLWEDIQLAYGNLLLISSGEKAVSFLQEEYAKYSIIDQKKSFLRPALISILALLLLISGLQIESHLLQKTEKSLTTELANRVRRHFPDITPGTSPVRSVEGRIALLKKNSSNGQGVNVVNTSILEAISELTNALRPVTNITFQQLQINNGVIVLEMGTSSYSEIEKIEKLIKAKSIFETVEIKNTRQNIRKEGVLFSLIAKLK